MDDGDQQQAKYYELCAYTLAHPDPSFIHQHVVDAFAAQRADRDTRPITLVFALVGLYLLTERNFSGRQVQRVHMLLARRRRQWPSFDIPGHRGDISVNDVMAADPGATRDQLIKEWAASVWEAYRASRDKLVALVETELG